MDGYLELLCFKPFARGVYAKIWTVDTTVHEQYWCCLFVCLLVGKLSEIEIADLISCKYQPLQWIWIDSIDPERRKELFTKEAKQRVPWCRDSVFEEYDSFGDKYEWIKNAYPMKAFDSCGPEYCYAHTSNSRHEFCFAVSLEFQQRRNNAQFSLSFKQEIIDLPFPCWLELSPNTDVWPFSHPTLHFRWDSHSPTKSQCNSWSCVCLVMLSNRSDAHLTHASSIWTSLKIC